MMSQRKNGGCMLIQDNCPAIPTLTINVDKASIPRIIDKASLEALGGKGEAGLKTKSYDSLTSYKLR